MESTDKTKFFVIAASAAAAALQAALLTLILILAANVNLTVLQAPRFDPLYFEMVETSFVYDSVGIEVAALHAEQNRVYLRLEQIPLLVRQAFIAVEDRRFYDHAGLDLFGSVRALFANLQHRGITQGASTITQQLARNAFLPPDRTVQRKLQEIWLALQIEKEYSKEEILELYLNLIYFGSGAYGVEAAARVYFGKSINEVNTAEAAMLAGMVCAPNYLNPFQNGSGAQKRSATALRMMLEHGSLSVDGYGEAVTYDYSYADRPTGEYPFSYFLDYVIHHELIKILTGTPEIDTREEAYRAVYTGGLRIYTTLDPSLQAHAEAVLNRHELYPRTLYLNMNLLNEKIRTGEFTGQIQEFLDPDYGIPQPQAALVLADPTGGRVLALVGGREYRRYNNEVLRYLSLRQPGSALKPLVVYAPAFESKLLRGAGQVIDDGPLTIGRWTPRNYDGAYHGMVTVRRALSYSYNVAAARIFQAITPTQGTRLAQQMGINTFTEADRQIFSTALGGITYGVTAYDMAQAYSVFAKGGMKADLHTIRQIEDSSGRVIYEHSAGAKRVLSEESSYLVTSILMDVATHTTAAGLRAGRPIAAKTGTTDQARDIYLVAYTPNIVASFWMGYDEPRLGGIPRGWEYSTRIVRDVLSAAFETLPPVEFSRPPGLSAYIICSATELLANEYCRANQTAATDLFFTNHGPRQVCDLHQAPPEAEPEYELTGFLQRRGNRGN